MRRLDETENLLLQLLAEMAQGKTLDCVVQGLQRDLAEDAPTVDEVRRYLLQPDGAAGLDACQRALVIDKLLECAEVNSRTLCDLIRYRHFKSAGIVSCVEEFLILTHPDEAADLREENRE